MANLRESKPETRDASLDKLAPFFRDKLASALKEANDAGLNVYLFEGYRTPERQQWLWEAGRIRKDEPVVTNAKPWQSWHQYALAGDCVFKDPVGKWTWKGPWDDLTKIMHRHGFESLSWERPHFQITGGLTWLQARNIAVHQGMLALWSTVEQSIRVADDLARPRASEK